MKKYLLGLFAIVLALGFSAYTKPATNNNKKTSFIYVVYNSGTKSLVGSYTQQTTQPAACTGTAQVCWFRVADTDLSGDIDQTEFTSEFNALDANHNGSIDDQSEITNVYEKQS